MCVRRRAAHVLFLGKRFAIHILLRREWDYDIIVARAWRLHSCWLSFWKFTNRTAWGVKSISTFRQWPYLMPDHLPVCATVLRYCRALICWCIDGYALSAQKMGGCKSALRRIFAWNFGVLGMMMPAPPHSPRSTNSPLPTHPYVCQMCWRWTRYADSLALAVKRTSERRAASSRTLFSFLVSAVRYPYSFEMRKEWDYDTIVARAWRFHTCWVGFLIKLNLCLSLSFTFRNSAIVISGKTVFEFKTCSIQ